MNRQAKSAIKSLVLNLRHRLEEDIAIGLKRYGFAGERWLPLERLPHIERDDAATADHFRLAAGLGQHLRRIGATPEKATAAQRGEAVAWFVREVAFTHLNRLVALKCLEARGLIPEIITVRDAYGGRARAHYEYCFDHPTEAAGADDALPAAIRHVCHIVHPEFRLLFDVGDPATGRKAPADDIVWPSYPVLRDCIALINGLDEAATGKSQMAPSNTDRVSRLTHHADLPTSNDQPPISSLWLEDEIIGWIYQFYNAEQKEAIRKRGAPQRPAEVAVINQFFTPRWIVKFLVDNTLGRLWLEMHPDSPCVRAKCDYLVPEPLAGAGGQGLEGGERGFVLDPDSPINSPQARPRRPAKRPQDIRLIDPACGTMHFGHYAFEVFREIYQDYYELYDDKRISTWRTASEQPEIASDILRHNLYGVDIDLRAVQLAALSLFIKAKHADPQARITQMNLVVADAVLPADGVRAQFLDRYRDDKVVQDAVRQVLDEMANVAEVGSLLRVEERLRTILARAGHTAATYLDPRPQHELPGLDYPGRQLTLADAPGAVPEDWDAHYTVARLLDDLREFAAQALQTHDLNAQLFAEEAEKSVHLLDVFLNDYDVAVMNPPYGHTLEGAQAYLGKAYPITKNDLFMAFVERAQDLVKEEGLMGALVSKTFFTLERSRDFRKRILLEKSSLLACLDLGIGILDDAAVETTAFVFGLPKATQQNTVAFVNLLAGKEEDKSFELFLRTREFGYTILQGDLQNLPGAAFIYSLPSSVKSLFAKHPPLDLRSYTRIYGATTWDEDADQIADVRSGLVAPNYDQFVHFRWEAPSDSAGLTKWVSLAKGGDFQTYYADLEYVLWWKENGKDAKSYSAEHYGSASRYIKNEKLFFQEGLTYSRVSSVGLGGRYLPPGCIFSEKGPAILASSRADVWYLIALINSHLVAYLIDAIHPGRSYEVLHLATVPFARPHADTETHLSDLARHLWSRKRAWDTGNETCTRFDAPWLIRARRGTLLRTMDDGPSTAALDLPDLPASPATSLFALLDYLIAIEHAADARLQQLQAEIDDAVYDLYEITPEDQALIERELGDRPPELVWPQMEGKADTEKRREHVRRLVSYFLLKALKEKRDGILPVTPVAGELSSLDAVRRGLEAEFGETAAFRMESDISQVLGQALAGWLDGPFIKWHTPLYKRRPIIWHLASPKNAFGCFVYLHKLDADTLRKVRTLYLWPRRRGVEAERDAAIRAKTAGERGAARRLDVAEALLDDLAEFEKRLLSVIQAQVKCEIPEWAEGPFRNGIYDPVLDDGVKVNITPLQEAGVLRYGKVV